MNKTQPPHPDYNQYGMKDAAAQAVDVYANRPGGEEPAVGPADAVDASGHRIGAIDEERGHASASSRQGRAVTGEKAPHKK